LVQDLVEKGDMVILVVPIDSAAPKGRLILPQQQVIRDLLEKGAIPIVVRDTELGIVLKKLGKMPKMVITDSQAFEQVAKQVPKEIPLTSFSILMARYKGNLALLAKNAGKLDTLKDGDVILMAEGCTHHRQCDDIGTVKIPKWMQAYTGKKLIFETASGGGYPDDLSKYAMVVHCGGCMLPAREMQFRMKHTLEQNTAIVNYGVLIAYMKGIVQRSLQLFPECGNE
ncbi:MAG: [Lachnospiraceae bacterium]|nr:[FeFe] hydrogenase H-cluster maturation GTPase HydF [Lachnospiraceae bacterium]